MMEQEILGYEIKSQENLKKIIVNYMQNFADSVDNVDGNVNTILTFSNNLKDSLNLCNDNISSLKELSKNVADPSYGSVLSRVMKNTLSIEDNLCLISEKSGLVSNISVNSTNVSKENCTIPTEPETELETILNAEVTSTVDAQPEFQPISEVKVNEPVKEDAGTVEAIQEVKENVVESNVESDKKEEYIENTLIVSEISGNVTLPYTLEKLNKTLTYEADKYSSLDDIILKKYTLPIKTFKNPFMARFKEAFKLMRKKEKGTIGEAISLGAELMFNYNLHPAIISACKDLDELDIYLDYLENGETQKFNCFKIVFELPPMLSKKAV